ncbi:MAG: T9SS type A sorting domain-containing protein [Flavobacteriales bacterium]|nr:T9SS type A sorting domain-containing protein [Flavobacteriales bacterium]
MKKLTITFLLMCCQWVAQAQVFAPEGSKWWYCWSGLGPDRYTDSLVYVNDTLIGNYEYKRIQGGGYLHFIRENGDTVFRHYGGEDYVLYNFSMEVGDTLKMEDGETAMYYFFPLGSYVTFELTEKGKMELGDDSVSYYIMKAISTDYDSVNVFGVVPEATATYMVAEKVGLLSPGKLLPVFTGPTMDLHIPFLTRFDTLNTIGVYVDPWFLSCGWLDVEEQTIQTSVSVYPNPVSDVLNLVSSYSEITYTGYLSDICGRKVIEIRSTPPSATTIISTEHLPSGIYVLSLSDSKGNRHSEKIIKN